MQITLNESEIMAALQTYVRSQINIAENQEITIDLKAGRGENGFSATLEIVPAGMKTQTAAPVTPVTEDKPKADAKESPFKKREAGQPAEEPEQEEASDASDEDVQEDTKEEETSVRPQSVFSKLKA